MQGVTDSFRHYLNRIGRIPLLTAAEEIELSRAVQAARAITHPDNVKAEDLDLTRAQRRIVHRGKRALNRMVSANLRLVVQVAKVFAHRVQHLETLDLVQMGAMGLQRACEKYDGTKGYKLSTYSYWWIRQSIQRGIGDYERVIRLPTHCNERVGQIMKAACAYMQQNGRSAPTMAQLGEAVGIPESEVRLLLNVAQRVTSLDLHVSTDADASTLLELQWDPEAESPMDALDTTNERVTSLLALLEPDEREFVSLHYGLNGGPEMSLPEIGRQKWVGRETVRSRVRRAQNKMRLHASLNQR